MASVLGKVKGFYTNLQSDMGVDLTGIMADFAAPLKAAKVPIFAISTW